MNLMKIRQLAQDIKTIKIQWATNIAKQAMIGLWSEMQNQKFNSIRELKDFLDQSDKLLRWARVTEPMLFNGLNLVREKIKEERWKIKDVLALQRLLASACIDYVAEIEKEEKIRPMIWAKVIKSGYNIVTHCHSWSVVKVLTTARNQWKKIHVYNTETRPLYQGRRTSNDLVKAWVPDTMITDDAAPFFVDNLYESHVNIDMVIIGCDAIKLDGSVYNKVWSFSIALAARHSKIPVYVVWSLTKLDTQNKVTIEKRSGLELWSDAPKGLEIINYAFDMVPAKFISWIITQYGIIKPKDFKKIAKKYCPWMKF